MSLQQTLDWIRSAPKPRDEENAKFQIIAPILGDLGWNPARQEILYEYRVGGKGKGKVDIALMGTKHPVALIEAKAPEENLADHVMQVLNYAFFEGVDVCVLTNGLEWWLYLPREDGPPEERRFTALRIKDDPIEQLVDDFETFLGKDNLVGGQAKEKAKQVLEAKHQAAFLDSKLPGLWKSMQSRPDDELVELLIQRTYDELNLRPERKQVVAVLRGSPVPTVVTTSRSVSRISSSETRTRKGQKKSTRTRTNKPKPIGMVLWNKHYQVKIWKDILLHVAGALHNEHGAKFIDRILAYRTNRGKPYASLNPGDLREGRNIPSTDVYLETNLNARDIQKVAHMVLGFFGHPSSDLEILYD